MSQTNYNTRQRELILDFIYRKKKEHITPDDIMDYLKNIDNPVGKATVYRFLDVLVNDGRVRKYMGVEGASACYQYIEGDNCHAHYHLKCNECGELLHIECDYLDEVKAHILGDHNFKVDNLKTVLYGTCTSCIIN